MTAAPRTYRISRFLDIEVSDEVFERPDGFDLAASWAESSRRLEAARHQGTALLRISPRGARLLPVRFGASGTRALENAGPPDTEGWTRVEVPVESRPVAVSDLLWFGTDAEVVGPPELREALTEAVAVLARRYAMEAPSA
ncbi:WYL domain-containing protein [Streptomyces tsukubensis]|nr:WYL domain-containing protein [Streptomyces tsukubensis]QFR97974.1 WYL domain-containing protein [Streptomyces tsukubensis]